MFSSTKVQFGSILLIIIATCGYSANSAERINQEGRILGPTPTVTTPTLFNTPEADAIVSAMQIFPTTSAWNEDISKRPLLSNSAAMMTQITNDLDSGRQTLRMFFEMNYVLVPDSQPDQAINFFNYPDESDPSPYPIPANLPIEGWPNQTGSLTLTQWQLDVNIEGGDRHAIMVMPGQGFTWETWLTKLEPTESPVWQASNGAKFDLKSNTLRTPGFTSGDAGGLTMFAPVVRYDECQRGMVEHAMRLVVKHSRKEYIYPATHDASSPSTTDPNTPAMGQRLRLNANFVIPSTWTIEEKAVALALKKYGAIVADNGNFFSISVCPDDRFPSGCFDNLSGVAISNFDVIQTTDAVSGPRAANPPTVDAGPDQSVTLAAGATLSATVGGSPANLKWYVYPYMTAPGTVTFSTPSAATTNATFSAEGTYTLMVSADDGSHAKAFDAVVVTVGAGGTAPPPGSFASPPAAGINNPVVGSSVPFTATMSGTAPFTYSWNFGDGSTDNSSGSVSHTYTAAGTYSVTVTAVDSKGVTAVATLSIAVGPQGSGATPPLVLSVLKFNGSVKPAKPGHDAFSISGTIPMLPDQFTPAGESLALNVNGASVNFTLDKHGHGKASQGTIALTLKKGVVLNTPFKAAIKNGDFSTEWAVPATMQKNAPLPLNIDLLLGIQSYDATIATRYSGAPGKGGTLKK